MGFIITNSASSLKYIDQEVSMQMYI